MKNNITFLSKIKKPSKQEITQAITSFSYTQRIFFLGFLAIVFTSVIGIISQYIIQPFQHEFPVRGGHHIEGIIGSPRFVNPVLSISNADKDAEQLMFAGLTRKTREGAIVLDLAEDFEVSEDGLVYTFTISENARFHDNKPITSYDVAYTVSQIQNPEIKSPKRVLWENITTQTIDEKTVRFVLTQPFIGFLENTTVGILPAHVWESLSSEEFQFSPYNTEPIGSGPYKLSRATKASSGVMSSYTLKLTKNYVGSEPFIKKITLQFFENQENAIKALRNKEIDAVAITNTQYLDTIRNKVHIYTATLDRMFGIFFNKANNGALEDRRVRQAIDLALNRQEIVQEALGGFGEAIKSPLSSTIQTNLPDRAALEQDSARAENLLDQAGWTTNSNGTRQKDGVALRFQLSTAQTPELQRAAETIQNQLKEIGIDIEIELLTMNDFNQNIVRPRNFELVLLGQTLNQEADIFPFWHSSQTSDPGLNITNYKNKTVDASLEQIIQTFDNQKRASHYVTFEKEFFKDIPAVFVYSPQLIYVVRDTLYNVELSPITNSSQRLLDIHTWYIETNFTFGKEHEAN